MKKFKLPYDSKTISLNLQNDNFARLLESQHRTYKWKESETDIVERYLDNPIASPTLNEEIVMHIFTNDSLMEKIGTLPSGEECLIHFKITLL